jgi:hypothetical protein
MAGYITGSLIRKIRTPEEYIELVRQLREDVFDLREAVEYDGEEMSKAATIIEALEYYVNELYRSFEDGSYEFKDEDLPYMQIVEQNNHTAVLPMLNLLKEVNRIHRNGLDLG